MSRSSSTIRMWSAPVFTSASVSGGNHVVAVDQLGFANVPQQLLDAVAALARDAPAFRAAVVDEAARDLLAGGRAAGDHGTALEVADDLDDTHRQQAPAVAQRARRAVVHDQ